jgi:hypothetical protein
MNIPSSQYLFNQEAAETDEDEDDDEEEPESDQSFSDIDELDGVSHHF